MLVDTKTYGQKIVGELMDVYDIELETQRQLKMFWAETGTNPSRSFTQQVPVKVLIAVGRNLFKKPEVMEEAWDHASCQYPTGGPNPIRLGVGSRFHSGSRSIRDPGMACVDDPTSAPPSCPHSRKIA